MKPKQQPKSSSKPKASTTDASSSSKKPKDTKKATTTIKGKQPVQIDDEVDETLPPPEKEKNLERFIYVTTYNDSDAMKRIKELFEEINQPAFNLQSVREIYTRNLTDDERDNNDIDYISGCQIIDKERRITIIEGITGKAMDIVKAKLPKYQMNTSTFKVFADKHILFNKRIYSKFDLSLKYIKLRDTLHNILTTIDIYLKAEKYRPIYNAFQSYGSILKSETMKEIANANLFPDAESLLLLERKYADILNEEDMTGVHVVKKMKKRIRAESLFDRTSNLNSSVMSGMSDSNKDNKGTKTQRDDNNKVKSDDVSDRSDIRKEKFKGKTDSYNKLYEEALKNKERLKMSKTETIMKNINYIKQMPRKVNVDGRFCRPMPDDQYDNGSSSSNNDVHFYSTVYNNQYVKWVENQKDKYLQRKNSYYTYSNYSLALTFPMVTSKNVEYLNYIENKRKWIGGKKDFDRYTQPLKVLSDATIQPNKRIEKYVYFPKIDNVL